MANRYFVIRERDGMPLACNQMGAGRDSMEKCAEVFRSLGVPCRVYAKIGFQHVNESRFAALKRYLEYKRDKYASMRGKQDANA